MLSKAEIKRRKQQLARDKARYCAERQELEKRRQQFLWNRTRHCLKQSGLHWAFWTRLVPASLEETFAVVTVTMAPLFGTKVKKKLAFFLTTAH